MAHVTFIHGISNKPPKDELLRLWHRALSEGEEALPLGDLGVTTSMVYWADVLYTTPDANSANHEGLFENTAEAIDGGGDAKLPVPANEEEALFLERLRARLTTLDEADIDEAIHFDQTKATAIGLERVPLPWLIKRQVLRAFLRDVHHYLFNTEYSPRPGDTYRVQEEIRKRFVAALAVPDISRPHIVVAHSMGTVIAYDCLKNVLDTTTVDGFITIGSPLGLDEIQDKLRPGWSRENGYPSERDNGDWANGYDSLDPVCGLDPLLANDFRNNGTDRIDDFAVTNEGAWRHSAVKYLRRTAFRQRLRAMLGV